MQKIHPLNNYVVEHEKISIKKIIQLASDFAIRLSEAYKFVSKSTRDWIPDLNMSRLSPWRNCIVKNSYGDILFQHGIYDMRGTGKIIGSLLQHEDLTILQKNLLGTLINDPSERYRQLANRYKSMHDFNTFCILCAISIEYWIFREVREKLKTKGHTDTQIDQMFTEKIGQKLRNISREDAIRLVTGNKEFKNTTEYTEFIDNVIYYRDSIVHGRHIILTVKETDAMVQSLVSFQKKLIQIFNKE